MSAAAVATSGRASVESVGERQIRIERVFNASRDKVWRCFTEVELVKQWWGRGNKLVVEKFEPVRGGHWRFVEQGPEGEHGFEGRFREVTPQTRIVQTFEWDGMPGHVSLDEANFEEIEGGRTRVRSITTFMTQEDRDGMVQAGMEGGLNESYAALDRLLATL